MSSMLRMVIASFGLTACPPGTSGPAITATCGAPSAPVLFAPNVYGDYSVGGVTRWTCTFSQEIALNRLTTTTYLDAVNCSGARTVDARFNHTYSTAVINVTSYQLMETLIGDTSTDISLRYCGWNYLAETYVDSRLVSSQTSATVHQ